MYLDLVNKALDHFDFILINWFSLLPPEACMGSRTECSHGLLLWEHGLVFHSPQQQNYRTRIQYLSFLI